MTHITYRPAQVGDVIASFRCPNTGIGWEIEIQSVADHPPQGRHQLPTEPITLRGTVTAPALGIGVIDQRMLSGEDGPWNANRRGGVAKSGRIDITSRDLTTRSIPAGVAMLARELDELAAVGIANYHAYAASVAAWQQATAQALDTWRVPVEPAEDPATGEGPTE